MVRPTDDTEAGIDEASRVLPVTTPSASGSPEDALDPDEAPPSEGPAFPVVGIGASSGGVEALELFFGAVPPNSGIAFIVIQHLDPTHESILAEIVARHAPMPVVQVEDGVVVEPNHAYVIPPNRDMQLEAGRLRLTEPVQRRGLRLPIDSFFRSLARDVAERAICLILSGSGTDGTLGLQEVKGQGGMVMVQDPYTAKTTGMPQSAIATGMADFVLPPEQMPRQILAYVSHVGGTAGEPVAASPVQAVESLKRILYLIHQRMGHDFSQYKPETVRRRVERRMAVNQIASADDYLRFLQQDGAETEILFRELLIGVTSFFRDPEAFDLLRYDVLPAILVMLPPGDPIRAWVPGCATGEEAYSIAILVQETLEEAGIYREVQIFATDVDSLAIDKARSGVYSDNIAADVTPERLHRYFTREGNTYHVASRVRDAVVFAVQSVTKDPPFSKLDLISCRNLLIYLGPELQRRVISLFHYALKPDGYLLLGASETLGELSDAFYEVSRRWKLFRRPRGTTLAGSMAQDMMASVVRVRSGAHVAESGSTTSLRDAAERLLLHNYAPASAVVSAHGEILYIHGRTGKYLEPAAGEPTHNVLQMARKGLRLPLSSSLRMAVAENQSVTQENVVVYTNGDSETIRLTVEPMSGVAVKGVLLVTFEPMPPTRSDHGEEAASSPQTGTTAADGRDQRIAVLEQELQTTRHQLQTMVEEIEASNEELTSTNEELQSANEELQSTNEELGTSKEELQSVNEELVTVNNELQVKIQQLTQATADIVSLLNSMSIAVIFLDRNLNIGRFNPPARSIINLIESDVGRPLGDLVSQLTYADLVRDCQRVLETLQHEERQVQDQEGRFYWMRIQPSRSASHTVEGVILTFSDISEQKRLQAELEMHRNRLQEAVDDRTRELQQTLASLRENEEKYRALVENTPDLIARFDRDLRHLYVNPAVAHTTGFSVDDYVGQTNRDLGMPDDLVAIWDGVTRDVFESREERSIQFEYDTMTGPSYLQARLVPERGRDGEVMTVLSVARDVTDVERTKQALAEALREKETLLRELYHRTKNNMQVISAIMELQAANITDEAALNAFQETQNRIYAIALVHQKLYESDNLADLDLGAYVEDLVDLLVATYATDAGKVEVVKDLESVPVSIDVATPCGLLLNELVSNALKHGLADGRDGRLEVQLTRRPDRKIALTVADDGVGVPEGFDFRKTDTLGIQAVIQIAEGQLLGQATFEGGPGMGVRCQVVFADNLLRDVA